MRTHTRPLAILFTLIVAGLAGSCGSDHTSGVAAQSAEAPIPAPAAKLDPPTLADAAPRDYAGLHNVVAYHTNYYSGSVPEDDAGFDSLAGMGVKTIITVDGAVPDLERAKARGMRYIHLPVGYNGFDESRKLELVRATRDALASGPVYIHCHHGKHRSAGAAAAVGASLGWATPEQMVERMKVSGTAPGYKGLYSCAASASIISDVAIDAVPSDFPEISRPKGFVKAMVEIDEVNDHLKLIEKAGWKAPVDHPDLVPVAEAGRMADILRVLCDSDRSKSSAPGFGAYLKTNADQAQALEDMLGKPAPDTQKLSAQFKVIAASCKDCHVKYRD